MARHVTQHAVPRVSSEDPFAVLARGLEDLAAEPLR